MRLKTMKRFGSKKLKASVSGGLILLLTIAIIAGFYLNFKAGHSDRINSVAFSPDGKILASASRDSTIKLWDVATGQKTCNLKTASATLVVAFSPDGKIACQRRHQSPYRIMEFRNM